MPSRNGAEFLEWSYNSIRKNQGNHIVEILVLDDNSDKDNTWEWCEKVMIEDPYFKAFRNTSSERLGISGGHKYLSDQATMDVICHWHNDMYLTPGALDAVEKELNLNQKTCVCLTRIEHSMGYQPGPEKVIWDNAPLEFNEWSEVSFLSDLPYLKQKWEGKTTKGHFAPYFISAAAYRELGSNDTVTFPLQSREDSDFGFRLVLAGIQTIQIPEFVFHFASRGNRRNKYETNTLNDNPVWVAHNEKATRNFIRKWQTLHLHDAQLCPTPPERYNVKFILKNATLKLVELLEPWCDVMEVDIGIKEYISKEQPNTAFDLFKKFHLEVVPCSVTVHIDGDKFRGDDIIYIQNLSKVITANLQIQNSTQLAQFGSMLIGAVNIKDVTHTLIKVDDPEYKMRLK